MQEKGPKSLFQVNWKSCASYFFHSIINENQCKTLFIIYCIAVYKIKIHFSHLVTKPTKRFVRLAKTRPVWSESSLSAWRKLGSLATHWAHSEDWSDWTDVQADLSLRWVQRSFCWFCWGGSFTSMAASWHCIFWAKASLLSISSISFRYLLVTCKIGQDIDILIYIQRGKIKFYSPFNSIWVKSSRWKVDNKKLFSH